MIKKKLGQLKALIIGILTVVVFLFFGDGSGNFFIYASEDPFSLLKIELIKDGFNEEKINGLYSNPNVHYDTAKVAKYFTHNEAKLNYSQFKEDDSIKNAFKYMVEHNDILVKAEKEYGVEKEVIIAILLVETRLGKYVGKNLVFSILSNVAALMKNEVRCSVWNHLPIEHRMPRKVFEKKADDKSVWAYKELKAFLNYTGQQKIDPLSIKGSYAGAVGIAQFMPSNLYLLGKDGDSDGSIDLFKHPDAICSVANYLSHYGWHSNVTREDAIKTILLYNNSTYYANTIVEIANILKG